MRKLFNKIGSFEKDSIVLFVLMMVSNVCNYLFQIITGRLLSVEDYATINTLLSLLTIFSVPNAIIALVSAHFFAGAENKAYRSIIKLLVCLVMIISVIVFSIGLFLSDYIVKSFRLDSKNYVVYIIFLSIISIINFAVKGILQGIQKFFQYGVDSVIIAVGKLTLSCILIFLGWRMFGVLTAIMTGTLLAIIYDLISIKPILKNASKVSRGVKYITKDFVRYAFWVVMAQGSMIVITNGDMLLIKYFFNDAEAGVYSSAMVIGKIAMYVASAVVATLFPLVTVKQKNGEDTKGLLKRAFLYGGGMCLICVAVFLTVGNWIIGVLFGERYLYAIYYLPAVCVFVVPVTFLTILMNYLLALDKAEFFAITSFMAMVGCVLMVRFFHKSIMGVMSICGGILTMVFFLNIFVYKSKNMKKANGSKR